MAHTNGNANSGLRQIDADYDADASLVHTLPKAIKDFVMYEADVPYDVVQIKQALFSMTAKEVLHALRMAQFDDRSKFYPGLDTPPRVCYDKDALWWSNFGG
ncbi:hypothetical protein PQB35_gp21 [Ochrobactrum phage vB_OspP_OH]|uniref:Uncharacterized protein n=1 Tax=Ochrobactrum phage vB_OspP_OH TaxID=2712957 RepID=A0A6G6XXL0_9CAUD|nr:hypothetical protein PQB35_gp21 [Ochrobactrum phage vB_OspP_OH]QIG66077.1 hypothetical protein phiOH_p21 [Ochrobactrum phage vB_OspP_OH]